MSAQEFKVIPSFSEIRVLHFTITSKDLKKSLKLVLNTQKIQEVIEFTKISPLPDSHKPFVGVLNLRDIPIPVVDPSILFFKDDDYVQELDNPTGVKRIVICEVLGKLVGLITDSALRITVHKDSEVYAKDMVEGAKNQDDDYINALVKENDHYYAMFNIEMLFDNEVEEVKNKSLIYDGKTVLIVEDSKLFQKKLRIYLESVGFKTIVAGDGIEGLEKYIEYIDEIDIVFSDIEMPRLNGVEMVRKLKYEIHCDCPIVFHSSISNQNLIDSIKEEKLGDFLVKFDNKVITHYLKKVFKIKDAA